MKNISCFIAFYCISFSLFAQQTPFESSGMNQTATYFQAIDFYKGLDKSSPKIEMKEMGLTDAGYPLHLVMISNDEKFDPVAWHQQNKVVILINNGIHPGEPDGIDASMMLARDVADKKILLPGNIALAIIPVYNIGGSLNRNGFSRVNQKGPAEYGFRGNSQNLDLNRDFTKCDSKEARSFTKIFHYLNPDILIDNHVSDGADYQPVITLITTQYDKLGAELGYWLKEKFEPAVYNTMAERKWGMVPYVNFETANPENSMQQFYDPPRYSSGYAALFQTISFMPETHMLKPFADRVRATYTLMQSMIEVAGLNAKELIAMRKKAINKVVNENSFPLSWQVDSSKHSVITFKGYEQAFKTSDATGLQRMFYDRDKPFAKEIKYYNVYAPKNFVTRPKAYIIPRGWYAVVELLKLNNVSVHQFKTDTTIEVETYHIDDYKSFPQPYEKHHKNYDVKVSSSKQKIKFLKGDYIIPLNQPTNRYIVEMLEPTGDDSFFAWNYFDAILQQKEGYSDYRWEDVASTYLKEHPGIKQKLNERKLSDPAFAVNASAQLDFIYKNSPYYETAHLRYPVYRLIL